MKKILVIEDSLSIRESTIEFLKLHGFDAIAAENGKQGIQIAQTYLPDLILCDVVMPEIDGYGVLTALRSNSKTATIPFIFITARSAKADFRQGMELGADDYLTKPFTPKELLKAIASRFEKQSVLQTHSQRQLDTLRNSIAMSLPHELRTPLHGIMGLAEVLMEDHQHISSAEIYEMAQGIHLSAERLYRLIQNFLLYAELEMALYDSERQAAYTSHETHYPQVLIANIATKIAEQANRAKDLRLNLQNQAIQFGDIHLKKVVEELVNNAFKFSPADTPVTLTSIVTDTSYTLYISDRGRGMTAQQIAQLGAYVQFERDFYEQQGSGLGIAIAKRLVELHKGEFSIDSDPGHQTIVCLKLQPI